jgi:hypothetical protein
MFLEWIFRKPKSLGKRHSEIEPYPSQPFGSSSPDKLLLEDSIL